MHSPIVWTWKDCDHSQIHPFLSSIHYAWFWSILVARVYDLSGFLFASRIIQSSEEQLTSKTNFNKFCVQRQRSLRGPLNRHSSCLVGLVDYWKNTECWRLAVSFPVNKTPYSTFITLKDIKTKPLYPWSCQVINGSVVSVWNTGLILSQKYVFNLVCVKEEQNLSFKRLIAQSLHSFRLDMVLNEP